MARIEFLQPARAPSPGQSAVFYQNGRVVGGGFIASIIRLQKISKKQTEEEG